MSYHIGTPPPNENNINFASDRKLSSTSNANLEKILKEAFTQLSQWPTLTVNLNLDNKGLKPIKVSNKAIFLASNEIQKNNDLQKKQIGVLERLENALIEVQMHNTISNMSPEQATKISSKITTTVNEALAEVKKSGINIDLPEKFDANMKIDASINKVRTAKNSIAQTMNNNKTPNNLFSFGQINPQNRPAGF